MSRTAAPVVVAVSLAVVGAVGYLMAEWREGLFTFLLLAVGVWYTVETFFLRTNAQAQLTASQEPFVVIDKERGQREGEYRYVLRNVGPGMAVDTRCVVVSYVDTKKHPQELPIGAEVVRSGAMGANSVTPVPHDGVEERLKKDHCKGAIVLASGLQPGRVFVSYNVRVDQHQTFAHTREVHEGFAGSLDRFHELNFLAPNTADNKGLLLRRFDEALARIYARHGAEPQG